MTKTPQQIKNEVEKEIYEKLTIKDKALLLDKYVSHAKSIRSNIYTILNPDDAEVKTAILSAEHFLRTLDRELKQRGNLK